MSGARMIVTSAPLARAPAPAQISDIMNGDVR